MADNGELYRMGMTDNGGWHTIGNYRKKTPSIICKHPFHTKWSILSIPCGQGFC